VNTEQVDQVWINNSSVLSYEFYLRNLLYVGNRPTISKGMKEFNQNNARKVLNARLVTSVTQMVAK